jgi:hypothetical protein
MTQWQSIETAPKDGTEIDVWCPEGGEGYRVPDAWWSSVDGHWLYAGQGNSMQWLTGPTHWMPKPPPPEGATP